MSQSEDSAPTKIVYGIVIAAFIGALAILALAAFLNRNEEMPATTAVPTPIIGSTEGPQSLSGNKTGQSADSGMVDGANLVAGITVQVASADGREAPLHIEASNEALVMDLLPDGEVLTVIEPSGDYAAYPVESDGDRWARVRASDGLVGWITVNALATAE